MSEFELTLDDGLIINKTNSAAKAYTESNFGKNYPHEYKNPTGKILRILCIDSPKFIPSDEILTSDERK